MRKTIIEEVKQLLTKEPMTAIELAMKLGYKTKEIFPEIWSTGAFRISELEDKRLVAYRDGKWHWIGNEEAEG